MKKILTFLFLIVALSTFAQEKTLKSNLIKIKMGQGGQFYAADETWINKYLPAGGKNSIVTFDIDGGLHSGEILTISNIGKSFTDRDVASTPINGFWFDFEKNVAPFIESVTQDVMVYRAEYSNSAFDEAYDKCINTIYEIKGIGSHKAFSDVRKKFPKVLDKLGWKIKCFTTTTGTYRLIVSRGLPNGWKELDDTSADFPTAYDQVYGKGSYEKDEIILSSWQTRVDKHMLTKNNALSSK
jgi:hypothetical protein